MKVFAQNIWRLIIHSLTLCAITLIKLIKREKRQLLLSLSRDFVIFEL